MVDCDGFENHCAERYRGFESLSLRHPRFPLIAMFNSMLRPQYPSRVTDGSVQDGARKRKVERGKRDKMLEECREEVIALEERRTKEAQSAQEAKEQRDSYQAALLHIEGEPTNGEANVQGQEEGSKPSD